MVEVRQVAARYQSYADIFVGGVPMFAADMVSFIASDLLSFGSAILGIMLLVLAVIFRRLRWVVIPVADLYRHCHNHAGITGSPGLAHDGHFLQLRRRPADHHACHLD